MADSREENRLAGPYRRFPLRTAQVNSRMAQGPLSSPRMANAKPQKEGVDRQNNSDKQQPPTPPVLPSTVATLLGFRQRRVLATPDNARGFLRRGRSRQQGNAYHDRDAKNPRSESAMVVGVVGAQQSYVWKEHFLQQPRKNKS